VYDAVPCTYINITRFTTCRVYVGIIIWTLFKEDVSLFHSHPTNTSFQAQEDTKQSFQIPERMRVISTKQLQINLRNLCSERFSISTRLSRICKTWLL